MVKILENVAALPTYVPGKKTADLDAVKLSSNENPYSPIPAVVSAGTEALRNANRYPQMYADDLVAALSSRWGLQPENIVVGNGSVALLNHALTAVAGAGDTVVMPWRSFEAYPIVIGATQAQIRGVNLTKEFRHDLDALAQAAQERDVKAVLLCSPNNPTGPALSETEVRDFMAKVPREVMVLLDEAYVQFVTNPDAVNGLELLTDYDNLLVARTFSKAYQLAGLRVGWVVGSDANLMAAIRKVSTPYGVNLAAAAAACEALQHEDDTARQVSAIVAERERTVAALREQGWKIPEAQGNFYWLPGAETVAPITAALSADHISARPFPEGVRISVGLPPDNDRVVAALATLR